MQIYGVQKTTLLDYPGKVAATVFTPGCNFRCPYCYNMDLAESPLSRGNISEEEVLEFLKKRAGVIDGICISGGEPTLQRDLKDFIKRARALGLLIKLDTNGSNPLLLSDLIEEKLLDYVAMDIKSSLSAYPAVCGVELADPSVITESISILLEKKLPYEFRTTVMKPHHNKEVFEEIGKMISFCDNYYLQCFKATETVKDHSLSPYSREELSAFADILKKYHVKAFIRGLDE